MTRFSSGTAAPLGGVDLGDSRLCFYGYTCMYVHVRASTQNRDAHRQEAARTDDAPSRCRDCSRRRRLPAPPPSAIAASRALRSALFIKIWKRPAAPESIPN